MPAPTRSSKRSYKEIYGGSRGKLKSVSNPPTMPWSELDSLLTEMIGPGYTIAQAIRTLGIGQATFSCWKRRGLISEAILELALDAQLRSLPERR